MAERGGRALDAELLERDSEFPRDGDARGRNWVALALHLAAFIPYYFATQSVISVGRTQSTQVRADVNRVPISIGLAAGRVAPLGLCG